VNFGLLMPEIAWLMFTHPRSMMRVLHICANSFECGPCDFATGGISPPPLNFPPDRILGTGQTHVGLCPKFLFLMLLALYIIHFSSLTIFCVSYGVIVFVHNFEISIDVSQ